MDVCAGQCGQATVLLGQTAHVGDIQRALDGLSLQSTRG